MQGRYKTILVDADSYLLELVRYIHLNPARADLVDELDDFHWSSHRCCLGIYAPPWLATDWLLGQLAENISKKRQYYQRFSSSITLKDVLDAVCAEYGLGLGTLAGPGRHQPYAQARGVAAWLVWRSENLQLIKSGGKTS